MDDQKKGRRFRRAVRKAGIKLASMIQGFDGNFVLLSSCTALDRRSKTYKVIAQSAKSPGISDSTMQSLREIMDTGGGSDTSDSDDDDAVPDAEAYMLVPPSNVETRAANLRKIVKIAWRLVTAGGPFDGTRMMYKEVAKNGAPMFTWWDHVTDKAPFTFKSMAGKHVSMLVYEYLGPRVYKVLNGGSAEVLKENFEPIVENLGGVVGVVDPVDEPVGVEPVGVDPVDEVDPVGETADPVEDPTVDTVVVEPVVEMGLVVEPVVEMGLVVEPVVEDPTGVQETVVEMEPVVETVESPVDTGAVTVDPVETTAVPGKGPVKSGVKRGRPKKKVESPVDTGAVMDTVDPTAVPGKGPVKSGVKRGRPKKKVESSVDTGAVMDTVDPTAVPGRGPGKSGVKRDRSKKKRKPANAKKSARIQEINNKAALSHRPRRG